MKKGFTIVELLIVIVVIAILAAIATVAYNGVTRRASESSVKSDLRNTATKIALYKTDNSTYPVTLNNNLRALSESNGIQYSSDGTEFCLTVFSKATEGVRFFVTHEGTIQQGECPVTWTQFTGGYAHSLALTSSGKIYSWGLNGDGQLGDGTTTNSSVPIDISDVGDLAGKTIVKIAAGNSHSLALDADGKVYGWGNSSNGEVGNSSYADQLTPVNISSTGVLSTKTITQIDAGNSHSLALASDGTVYTWGSNNNGQIGDGTTVARRISPWEITSSGALAGKSIEQVVVGSLSSYALTTDGKVLSWGYNYQGRLGDGTSVDRNTPVDISNSGTLAGKVITKLAPGTSHVFALASDGTLSGWGYNYRGLLGIGTSTNGILTPIVTNSSGALAGKTINQLASRHNHSFAVTTDGTIYAWGQNLLGTLGDGTETDRYSPVSINSSGDFAGNTISQISGSRGGYQSFAIDASGKLYTWGGNTHGQLGDGSLINRALPAVVSDPW